MADFNFEKNLPHQQAGIKAVLRVLKNCELQFHSEPYMRMVSNPILEISPQHYSNSIKDIQSFNNIPNTEKYCSKKRILDISMETGTGKTYTYTKTILEINKQLKANKFIVVVPTLSIKAGTINFLTGDATKEHFRDDYNREIKVHVLESSKKSNNNKQYMPQAVMDFVNATNINDRYIHILVVNSGMLNSDTVQKNKYDVSLLQNQYDCPIEALSAIRPIVIMDEPHKFPVGKKTWNNLLNLNPQYLIRYGATFKDQYFNLLYNLTALEAFNQNLVKGIKVFVEELEGKDKASIKLLKIEHKTAKFELSINGKKHYYELSKGQSLSTIHSSIYGLNIETISSKRVILSNGLELGVKDVISPYSYSESIIDSMIQKAIKEHFKIEKELLTQSVRIKPITLFFIDDIEGYRDEYGISGSLKEKFEKWLIAEVELLLETETNTFYRSYLEKTLKDITLTHGGYFSKDNSDNDEKIIKEVTEILHDKQSLLSLENTRRFIFSKWTLREGWDNPNVFQICKLRSSGSNTSKLQEVGRGLRLPVNEYMSRVKNKSYKLNYFVDFTERDFVGTLINEVNQESSLMSESTKLLPEHIESILNYYSDLSKFQLLSKLIEYKIIDENENFINNDIASGFNRMKDLYPNAFNASLMKGKITYASDKSKFTTMRTGKYTELKELWELLNQKVILKYDIKDENEFYELFCLYLKTNLSEDNFKKTGLKTNVIQFFTDEKSAYQRVLEEEDDNFSRVSTMSYHDFLEQLAQKTFIKKATLHRGFIAFKDQLDITDYLNINTINNLTQGFRIFLLQNAFHKFQVGYKLINDNIHPTKFTDMKGHPLRNIDASDLGSKSAPEETPASSYLFNEVFYDSELEKNNISKEDIEMVTVFTKIPKNSIKIPLAGGFTYSPDFAYVIETKEHKILNFVIETKDVENRTTLRPAEIQRIKHAEQLFSKISKDIKVNFRTQISNHKIADFIRNAI